jgi:hypothetical protein
MHAPSKSTARIASKSAGSLIVASGLWPEFRRLSGSLSEHSLDAARFPEISRSLPNNPRNGCGSFPSRSDNFLKAPASCRKVSANFPDASANCPEVQDNCPGVSANCRSGRANFLKDAANLLDASGNWHKDSANCPGGSANFLNRSAN